MSASEKSRGPWSAPRVSRRLALEASPLTRRDVLALVAPALIAVEIRIVGRLFLTELVLLGALPFLLLAETRRRLDLVSKLILGSGVLWLVSQVVTDLVRHSAFHDFARGWSRAVFTISTLLALDLLFRDGRRRIELFALGLSLGLLMEYLFSPDALQRGDSWKFGLGFPITLLLVLVASQRAAERVPPLRLVILCSAALLNLALGFRSLGGICFLAAGYVAFQAYSAKRAAGPHEVSIRQVAAISALTIVLGVGFLQGYEFAAQRGLLGKTAEAKYANQSSGRFAAVLVDARPTFYIGAKAIADSPVIGHGSWARNQKYTTEALADLDRAGYQVDPNLVNQLVQEDRIPAHSYLLEAWVDAGVLGGVFWLVVLGLVGAVFLTLHRISDPLSPLIAFLMMFLAWSILLSPYGAEQRVIAPYAIAVLLYAWRRSRVNPQRSGVAPARS